MDGHFTCELNLALIPDEELAGRHIALSRKMARRYPTVIQLNGVTPRVAFAPHVTRYQVPVPVSDLLRLSGDTRLAVRAGVAMGLPDGTLGDVEGPGEIHGRDRSVVLERGVGEGLADVNHRT